LGIVAAGPGSGSSCAGGGSGHRSTVRSAAAIESDVGVVDGGDDADVTGVAVDTAARDGLLAVPQPAVTTATDKVAAMQSQAPDGVRDRRAMPSLLDAGCPSMNEASRVIA
jgi:hypothetical protein